MTVIESASESTSNSNFYRFRIIIVEEDVHIDEMSNAMPIRKTATSSLFQPFVTSSVVMENGSFNSNFTPVDEGENFSRATFSLFSQQLLSPMWNEKEEEKLGYDFEGYKKYMDNSRELEKQIQAGKQLWKE